MRTSNESSYRRSREIYGSCCCPFGVDVRWIRNGPFSCGCKTRFTRVDGGSIFRCTLRQMVWRNHSSFSSWRCHWWSSVWLVGRSHWPGSCHDHQYSYLRHRFCTWCICARSLASCCSSFSCSFGHGWGMVAWCGLGDGNLAG